MLVAANAEPGSIAWIAAQQDELEAEQGQLAAQLNTLVELLTDLAIADERQDAQIRTLARSLRETAAEQGKSFVALAKAARAANGKTVGGKAKTANDARNGDSASPSAGDEAKTQQGARAANGGAARAVELVKPPPANAKAAIAAKTGEREARPSSRAAAERPSEPAEPRRIKAHRWI